MSSPITAKVIADDLRSRITNHQEGYRVGDQIPVQTALAEEFGVHRDLIRRAVLDLQQEKFLSAERGQGATVISSGGAYSRSRPGKVGLGTLLAEAFAEPHVSLDVYSLTAESIKEYIAVQVDRLLEGSSLRPRTIKIRLLLPAADPKPIFPRAVIGQGPEASVDSDGPHLRWNSMLGEHVDRIHDKLESLNSLTDAPEVDFEVRRLPVSPICKYYIVNKIYVLWGMYELEKRQMRLGDAEGGGGQQVEAFDAIGLRSQLAHFESTADRDAQGSVIVASVTDSFLSFWSMQGVEEKRWTIHNASDTSP